MFFLAISPPYVTRLSPVYVLIVYLPSGPMSAVLVGTIRPELLGLKLIVPPVTGTPLAVTTPVTVASVERGIIVRLAVPATRERGQARKMSDRYKGAVPSQDDHESLPNNETHVENLAIPHVVASSGTTTAAECQQTGAASAVESSRRPTGQY